MREERDVLVTTGRKVNSRLEQRARQAAAELGTRFVPRGEASLEQLREEHKAARILVAKNNAYVLDKADGEFFFHPSMAHIRIKNLRRGMEDQMIAAMELKEGMSVLDCTLGFAADAIVASFVAGESGQVTGLEVSPLVAFIVSRGLAELEAKSPQGIEAAMRRIRVRATDYEVYLRQAKDKSVDIVYLDPMFRCPMQGSTALQPLRELADHRPVDLAAIAEARRVARRRIVIKEASYSREFERLGCTRIRGGKYSKIHYGIIDLGE